MVRRGAKTTGPFSTKVIQDKAREGQLLPADQVKQVGQLDWRAAASIGGLFSAEVIQQAASASPQGNDVPGEGNPEALPIGTEAFVSEALPANMPAPPAFQKKTITGHTNTKRNLIIVSSSVGGIVLITAIALVIIFNLPNSETDDIIPVESDEKITVVVEEPLNPQADNTPTQTSTPAGNAQSRPSMPSQAILGQWKFIAPNGDYVADFYFKPGPADRLTLTVVNKKGDIFDKEFVIENENFKTRYCELLQYYRKERGETKNESGVGRSQYPIKHQFSSNMMTVERDNFIMGEWMPGERLEFLSEKKSP